MIKSNKAVDHYNPRAYIEFPFIWTVATHWEDGNGKLRSLCPALKMYYMYRRNEFEFYHRRGKLYSEPRQVVARKLGIGVDTIRKVYDPLLKEMGLIIITKQKGYNKYSYTVKDLNVVSEKLINEGLAEEEIKVKEKKSYTHKQYKTNKGNRERANKMRDEYDRELFPVTKEEITKLRG